MTIMTKQMTEQMTKKEIVSELVQDFEKNVKYHINQLMRKKKSVLISLVTFKRSLTPF